jgi:hypothetical protein
MCSHSEERQQGAKHTKQSEYGDFEEGGGEYVVGDTDTYDV